jgi:glycerol-3-phosphate acyltransferase PlsX
MKPIEALRLKDSSNLGMAINSLAKGEVSAMVSAANTGAYVALAKIVLGTLPGIDRPAISAIIPTMTGKSIMLDLGSTLRCSSECLIQFALMGEVFAKILLQEKNPSIGLLNVGAEEMKGDEVIQRAGSVLNILRKRTDGNFNFYGFVEGDDIFTGKASVIITDGFSGNISLKSIEGTIFFFFELLKKSMKKSIWNKVVALAILPFLKQVKNIIDPRLYNGAVFLGLQKIAVKSHGAADSFGFAKAISVAVNLARSNFSEDIEKRLQLLLEIQ